MPYRPMPCVHSQSFQPLVSMTRPSSSLSRNSPELSLISTRLRISNWICLSMSAALRPWARLGKELLQVKHFDQRPVDGPAIGMGLHEVFHVVPPAAPERVFRQP